MTLVEERIFDSKIAPEAWNSPADDLLRIYLNQAGASELLTAEDEVRLAQIIEDGRKAEQERSNIIAEYVGATATDRPARRAQSRELETRISAGEASKEQFINSNLRLVVKWAKRYRRTVENRADIDLLDIIQHGNMGLMTAVDKFDWRKGFKFSTYATWWIRHSIDRGLTNESGTIRIPKDMHDSITSLFKVIDEMTADLKRLPTDEEVAELTGMSLEEVKDKRAVDRLSKPKTLNQKLRNSDDADGATLEEVIAAPVEDPFEAVDNLIMQEETREMILWAMKAAGLTEKESQALRCLSGLDSGEPLRQIEYSKLKSVSRQYVNSLENRGLDRLRVYMTNNPEISEQLVSFLR